MELGAHWTPVVRRGRRFAVKAEKATSIVAPLREALDDFPTEAFAQSGGASGSGGAPAALPEDYGDLVLFEEDHPAPMPGDGLEDMD